ncbi:MAG: hypothetical protein PHC94_15300 [Methylobacter sp.]|nr:hypothetical protein [Methylococcales bacterium]MDD5115378.1 hypothetical protein [Methylobacter sp.]
MALLGFTMRLLVPIATLTTITPEFTANGRLAEAMTMVESFSLCRVSI